MASRATTSHAEMRRRAADLRQRGEKLIAQAEQMEALTECQPAGWQLRKTPAPTVDSANEDSAPGLWAAESCYTARRRRDRFFQAALFGEPAWDILLDLYLAGERGTPVSISSACLAGGTAPTTGLRWLSILDDHGLTERERNASDGRMSWVRLSNKGRLQMQAYLADVMSLIAWDDVDCQARGCEQAFAKTG